jgi:hypothetical protein
VKEDEGAVEESTKEPREEWNVVDVLQPNTCRRTKHKTRSNADAVAIHMHTVDQKELTPAPPLSACDAGAFPIYVHVPHVHIPHLCVCLRQ